MNRLEQELQRLFGHVAPHDPAAGTRALMLLSRPADWRAVMQLVQGAVQDLALPAPAIAVSGTDGFQIWFSCQAPVTFAHAQAFLRGLITRYWPQIDPQRLLLDPNPSAQADAPSPLPPREVQPGQWSAFIAPDLGALFADTPWLDTAPSPQAQAEVLSTVQSITPQAFADALTRLQAGMAPAAEGAGPWVVSPPPTDVTTQGVAREPDPAHPGLTGGYSSPHVFLLDLMNDPSAPLRWRVEAAKALLHQPG